MLKLSEIRLFFPDTLQRFPRFMLREYLQVKILEILFESPVADQLCFLGGTCLRIVHGNQRFSEDLDFDNRGISVDQFEDLAKLVRLQLRREGYEVELRTVMPGAWHCYIKFPGLLFEQGLSGHQEEKILIQLDLEAQQVDYEPERFILNQYEVFTTILTTPLAVLLSQKLYTIINRKRKMGRDFFDVVFLFGKGIQPDYSYLKKKAGISEPTALKRRIIELCQSVNMATMARDVEPFLFTGQDTKRVIHFEQYLLQILNTEAII